MGQSNWVTVCLTLSLLPLSSIRGGPSFVVTHTDWLQKARKLPELRVASKRFSLICFKAIATVKLTTSTAPPPSYSIPKASKCTPSESFHTSQIFIVNHMRLVESPNLRHWVLDHPDIDRHVPLKRNPRLKTFSPSSFDRKIATISTMKQHRLFWMKMVPKITGSVFVEGHIPFESRTPTPSLASYLCLCKIPLANYQAFPFGQ